MYRKIIGKRIRERPTGRSLFHELMVVCRRMEYQHEEDILAGVVGDPVEESPESPPLAEQPAVSVVVIDIPLGLEVEEELVGSPRQRIRRHRLCHDDGEQIKELCDCADLKWLLDRMEHTRIMRGALGYQLVEPLFSERLKTILRILHRPQ